MLRLMSKTTGQKVMDQLRAIYVSRGWTQAKLEQQSPGQRLKQSTISRLLKGVQDDPGIDQVLLFAEALNVDFLDLMESARGHGRDRRPTVVAELQSLREDVAAMNDRLGHAIEALAESEKPPRETRKRAAAGGGRA